MINNIIKFVKIILKDLFVNMMDDDLMFCVVMFIVGMLFVLLSMLGYIGKIYIIIPIAILSARMFFEMFIDIYKDLRIYIIDTWLKAKDKS